MQEPCDDVVTFQRELSQSFKQNKNNNKLKEKTGPCISFTVLYTFQIPVSGAHVLYNTMSCNLRGGWWCSGRGQATERCSQHGVIHPQRRHKWNGLQVRVLCPGQESVHQQLGRPAPAKLCNFSVTKTSSCRHWTIGFSFPWQVGNWKF